MGQALYRKYRSKSLSEIVGQDHIISTLQNAIKKGSISHAYLFTGPRGTGKTSIARILAHEINGLDYNEATTHIDIIEIDAASNRRIDEIRDLRDKVHIAPTSAKYKIYIIDEVHMLTKEAFNALLKTLEEPPAHVIFILATTEAHKLPETIISRTQRFQFKSIEPTKAVEHLKTMAKGEKLEISNEALELIAEHGNGSFRDSIGLLDQVSSLGRKIEADDVRDMLGIAPTTMIEELYTATFQGSAKQLLDNLTSMADRGYEPSLVAKQLAQVVRQKLLDGSSQANSLTQLLGELIEVPASSNPTAKLEVVLLGINLQHSQPTPTAKAAKVATLPVVVKESPTPPAVEPKSKPAINVTDDFNTAWGEVVNIIKKKYNTLYGVLRMAQPEETDDGVTLHFEYAFHQKRINENKNRQLVAELLSAQLGKSTAVKCVINKDAKAPPLSPSKPAPKPDPSISNISNIFGAAEVLES
ncbi:MAG: DNA polymerase III subunit gamma/tau [Candidatus Saccharimonadales bacterium]